jgi:hypothetical protein
MDVAKLDGLQLFEGLSMQQRELVAQHAVEVDVPEARSWCVTVPSPGIFT